MKDKVEEQGGGMRRRRRVYRWNDEEGEVDVETLPGEGHIWKVEEEVDLVEKWLSLGINTYQHLGKDKI